MKIKKTYRDEEKWFTITEKEFLSNTEDKGYFKEGTALKLLKDLEPNSDDYLQTAWAYFQWEE
nr:hypothetical protein [uncultured Mediterranean phage uvMED]